MSKDPDLGRDIDDERAAMYKIHNRLLADEPPPSLWHYGHYHNTYSDRIAGIDFHMLDIGQIREILTFR